MGSVYSVSVDICMILKASSDSRNMLGKGYQHAVKKRRECSSVSFAAEPAAQDKLQLSLKVCLVYF